MHNRGNTCGPLWDSAGDNPGDEWCGRALTCDDVVHSLWTKEFCRRNRLFTFGRARRATVGA